MRVRNGRDLIMIRGDTESILVRRTGKDGAELPFREGDAIRFSVKRFLCDEEAVLYKEVTAFPEGRALIALSHEDTKNLPPFAYVYDVELTTSGGAVKTLIGPSKFIVEGDVTRA